MKQKILIGSFIALIGIVGFVIYNQNVRIQGLEEKVTVQPTPEVIASPSHSPTPKPATPKPTIKTTPTSTPSLPSSCTQEEAQEYLKTHFSEGIKFDGSVQLSCDRDKSVKNTKELQPQ